MSGSERYFIKPGYMENKSISTMDHLSGSEYWTAARRRNSRIFQYHVYEKIKVMAQDAQARLLVDVGCGIGTKLESIHKANPDLKIFGIDQDSAIKVCKEIHGFGEWIADDFENPSGISIPENPDIVVCSDVVEHVRNPDLLLEYIRGIAGRDTRIVISTPERDRLRGKDCDRSPHPHHVREWNASELRCYVESRGFEVLETQFLPAWRPNLHPRLLMRDLMSLLPGRTRNTNQLLVLRATGQDRGSLDLSPMRMMLSDRSINANQTR